MIKTDKKIGMFYILLGYILLNFPIFLLFGEDSIFTRILGSIWFGVVMSLFLVGVITYIGILDFFAKRRARG